jgi:F0F1-type ATP synthase assembly protein I
VKEKSDGFMASALRYTAIAITLPATTFGGYVIGHWTDQWLGTHFFTMTFLILGIVSGFAQLIRELTRK